MVKKKEKKKRRKVPFNRPNTQGKDDPKSMMWFESEQEENEYDEFGFFHCMPDEDEGGE